MKNYYDQQLELNVILMRIETKNEEKALYFQETQPSSPKYSEKVNASHKPNDPFLRYAAKVEEINKELDELYKEKEILEKYLKKMEHSLRQMKGILEKIFVAKYIDGLTTRQICMRVNYSKTAVYRYLQTIHAIIKDGKKWE